MSRSGEIGRHATFRALCSKGHGGSSPPFGMPKISFESHHNSSEATSCLRLFCLWGNTSLTGIVTGTRSFTFEHLSFPLFHISPGVCYKRLITSCRMLGGMCYIPCLSSCRCYCGRAIPGNLPSTRGLLRCGADCENGYRVNQPSSATPSTDQRHLLMD